MLTCVLISHFSEAFPESSTRMKPPAFVCPSYIVILLWHRSCSFYRYLAFASAVWAVRVCMHTLTHTVLAD